MKAVLWTSSAEVSSTVYDLEENDTDDQDNANALRLQHVVKTLQHLRRIVSQRRLSRRLLVVSIQHDYVARLRRAFDTFKTPFGPRAMSIKEQRLNNAYNWQRRHLLSSMFGMWVGYVQEQQHLNERSMAQSESFFYHKSMRKYFPKFQKMCHMHHQSHRHTMLGMRYVSTLRLFEGDLGILSIVVCTPSYFPHLFYPLIAIVFERFGNATSTYPRTFVSTSTNIKQMVSFCLVVSTSKTGMELAPLQNATLILISP